jgi:hypothetical protein
LIEGICFISMKERLGVGLQVQHSPLICECFKPFGLCWNIFGLKYGAKALDSGRSISFSIIWREQCVRHKQLIG